MKIVDEKYQRVLAAVEAEVELEDGWLYRRDNDSTDARALLIHWLTEQGLSRRQIERKTGLKPTTVRQHVNGWAWRRRSCGMLRDWDARVWRRLVADDGDGVDER